jgi:hypothetical protein
MNRLEELTFKVVDGSLTEAEFEELNRIIAEAPSRDDHFELLRIESALRQRRANLDLRESTLERVRRDDITPLAVEVLRQIRAEAPPSWIAGTNADFERSASFSSRPRPGAGWRKPAAALAVVFLFALAAVLWFSRSEPLGAIVASVGGNTVIVRSGKTIPLNSGLRLQSDDVIRTSTGANVSIQYEREETQIALRENTELKLLKPRKGKKFALARGDLSASVAPQPAGSAMTISTPLAEAKVIGTKFNLSARSRSTWLEVSHGSVRFSRVEDGVSTLVEQGNFAVAARGVELTAQSITTERNLSNPFPVKVPLFSEYSENTTWFVSDEAIRQTEVISSERAFRAPPFEGSFQMEVTVQLDRMTSEPAPGLGSWGFGCILSFVSDGRIRGAETPRRETVEFGSQQHDTEGSVLRIVDPSTGRILKAAPFSHPSSGVYQLKLRFDPAGAGTKATLRGKVWQGGPEPEEWMVQSEVSVTQPLSYVALSTCRGACTFTRMKLGLIE